jgi:hypothetical protein
MLISRHQTAERNRNMKIANKSFEIVAKLKYLGTIITNKN